MPKVKLDITAIKKWLLEHGEKLALGCTLLIFLLFTWSAISREVLEPTKQPLQLQQQATQVGTHVTKSPWEEKTAGIQLIAYDERAKRERIAPAAFPWANDLNKPLADPKTKRASPELLPIEELKVASGFGTFALKDDMAAPAQGGNRGGGGVTKLKGLPWVAITGLVPAQKQALEYARVFDRAMRPAGTKPEQDTPKYADFKIERAEINDEDPAKLQWKRLAQAPIVKEFGPPLQEVVRPEFVDPELTMPLKPLEGGAWGAAVTHPKIPLAVQSNAQSSPPPPVADDPKEADLKESDDGFQGAHAKKDPAAKPADAAINAAKTDDAEFGYRLFRAFDFTVEPNRKYRYRVVVRLENPNFGLSRQYLKDPETANQEFLVTKSTEPSGVISVPDGYQVLAGVVKPPPRFGEPSAKLLLIAIDKDLGVEATYELEVGRGTAANAVKDVKVRNRRNPQQIEEMSDVKFKTDMIVLDMRGGKKVSVRVAANLASPGEVLLLDRNGDLMVRSELDDQSMYENRKPPDETEAKARPDPIPDTPKPVRPKRPKPR